MIDINKNRETYPIGELNAANLFELAGYIAIKNGHSDARYTLQILIDDARENPGKRVFEYVRDRTSKD